MENKSNIHHKLKEFVIIKGEMINIFNEWPEQYRLKPLFDKWSLKDVVAHLSNWMIHDIECLNGLKQGTEPYWEPSTEEFNLKGVSSREGYKWDKVYSEFVNKGEELEEIYNTMPEGLWDVPIWRGYGLTARKFLQADIDHWKNEHLVQMRKYLSDTVTQ
jgi:hypothetical protein